MIRHQKSLLYVIIFSVIFGVVTLGMLSASSGGDAPASAAPDRVDNITRALRNYDDYFVHMSDRQIVRAGHVVCAMLDRGSAIETVIGNFQQIPPGPVGDLLDSAISRYCPEFKPKLQGFIMRYSRPQDSASSRSPD